MLRLPTQGAATAVGRRAPEPRLAAPASVPAAAGASGLARRRAHVQRRGRVVPAAGLADVISPLATTVALAGCAYLLSQQNNNAAAQRRDDEGACPSCGGSGVEPCMCTKWSDGDVGCGCCNRTGFMRCRSCGGKGTPIPIQARIVARSGRQ